MVGHVGKPACRLARSIPSSLGTQWGRIHSLVKLFSKKTRLILILSLGVKLGQQRIKMVCSKDTAKDTGLNVWVDADASANANPAAVE